MTVTIIYLQYINTKAHQPTLLELNPLGPKQLQSGQQMLFFQNNFDSQTIWKIMEVGACKGKDSACEVKNQF